MIHGNLDRRDCELVAEYELISRTEPNCGIIRYAMLEYWNDKTHLANFSISA